MKKFMVIILVSLCLATTTNQVVKLNARPNAFDFGDVNARDAQILEILQGWMNFLRLTTSDSCLPINEAKESELESGVFTSDFFVPAQLAYKIMAEMLSYEVRKQFPELTAGFTKNELLASLNCTLDSLEDILDNYAYHHPETGKKALYQIHLINGVAPLNANFDKTVSMLDNVYLITALELVTNWAAEEDEALMDRLAPILDEFDLGMWINDSGIYLGGPENSLSGPLVDRIVSEGRLAPVLALARGEINFGDFQEIINKLRWNSLSGEYPEGNFIRRWPFFGTALEIWVPTTILSVELETVLACETLHPLVHAWEASRWLIPDLPAAGASGFGNGFGGFLDCSMQPAESSSNNQNKQLLVVPGALIQGGAMMSANTQALCNFSQTYNALRAADLLHPSWGPPNYIDYGSGLVNTDDYLRGTLEIGQAAVALLNTLLGGRFIEETLRRNEAWDSAMNQYKEVLGTRIVEKQAEDVLAGNGRIIQRFPAFDKKSLYLPNKGDFATYEIFVASAGNYSLLLHYSNSDLGTRDSIVVRLNDQERAQMRTVDTGDGGFGWENLVYSEAIDLGFINAGEHLITFELSKSDGYGVELDFFALISADERNCLNVEEDDVCLSLLCTDTDTPLRESEEFEKISLYPNPSRTDVFLLLPASIQGPISITIGSVHGQLYKVLNLKPGELLDQKFHFNLHDLPPGAYTMEVSNGKFVKSLLFNIIR